MKVEYQVKGSLLEVLYVVYELRAMAGMEPEAVVLDDGCRVKFKYDDFRFLKEGEISDKEYIDRNLQNVKV